MGTLTTPNRVRNRVGKKEADLSDTIVNEFIADAEARVNAYVGYEIHNPLPEFPIAQAAATDLAAYYALIRDLGNPDAFTSYELDEFKVDKTDPMQNRLKLIEEVKASAEKNIALLIRDPSSKAKVTPVLIPRNSADS